MPLTKKVGVDRTPRNPPSDGVGLHVGEDLRILGIEVGDAADVPDRLLQPVQRQRQLVGEQPVLERLGLAGLAGHADGRGGLAGAGRGCRSGCWRCTPASSGIVLGHELHLARRLLVPLGLERLEGLEGVAAGRALVVVELHHDDRRAGGVDRDHAPGGGVHVVGELRRLRQRLLGRRRRHELGRLSVPTRTRARPPPAGTAPGARPRRRRRRRRARAAAGRAGSPLRSRATRPGREANGNRVMRAPITHTPSVATSIVTHSRQTTWSTSQEAIAR